MNLKALYSLPPISTSKNFSMAFEAIKDLSRYSMGNPVYKIAQFCNSVENFCYSLDDKIDDARFQINMYLDEGDEKYGARLYTVVFDNVPIMMVKNDGRYYDNYQAYLSNENQLYALIDYIYSLIETCDDLGKPLVFSEDEDIADLTKVNNYNLFDYYDKNNQPLYQKDDLVWAWVPENHLKYNFSKDYQGYVLTQVCIDMVHPFNKIHTYYGSQRERGWCKFPTKMKLYNLNENGVGIGCSLNDKLILGKVGEIPEPKFAIKNFVDSQGYLLKSYKVDIETILENKIE